MSHSPCSLLSSVSQECVRRCVQDAERSIREECDMKAEREKRALQDRHEEEISEQQNR